MNAYGRIKGVIKISTDHSLSGDDRILISLALTKAAFPQLRTEYAVLLPWTVASLLGQKSVDFRDPIGILNGSKGAKVKVWNCNADPLTGYAVVSPTILPGAARREDFKIEVTRHQILDLIGGPVWVTSNLEIQCGFYTRDFVTLRQFFSKAFPLNITDVPTFALMEQRKAREMNAETPDTEI